MDITLTSDQFAMFEHLMDMSRTWRAAAKCDGLTLQQKLDYIKTADQLREQARAIGK